MNSSGQYKPGYTAVNPNKKMYKLETKGKFEPKMLCKRKSKAIQLKNIN